MQQPQVIVIGGGFAGLSAAVELAAARTPVLLLEAKAMLGGRACSRFDRVLGTWVDNGQHAMMGCYRETLAFLQRIGACGKLHRQANLRVDLLDRERRWWKLAAPPWPSPLHMVSALLHFSALTKKERLLALLAGLRWMQWRRVGAPWLRFGSVADLFDMTCQSSRARKYLWDPIVIATMNERPEKAAAQPFAEVLARAFFASRTDSQFVFSQVGLSDLYVQPALRFLQQHGTRVLTQAVASELVVQNGRAKAVRTRDGKEFPTLAVVCTAPPEQAAGLLGRREWAELFSHAPIVSVHLAYGGRIHMPPFVGLIGTHAQWLFHRRSLTKATPQDDEPGGEILSVVLSAAREEVHWDDTRLVRIIRQEIESLLPELRHAPFLAARVIREKRATVSLTPASQHHRPPTATQFSNVFLAGDWTATGLPATIEGAVLSGKIAAQAVQKALSHGYTGNS